MLIPNFLASVRDRGYMEAFMDWRLIYRDHADMQALAAALPPSEVADCQIFDDGDEAITFLLVTKASERVSRCAPAMEMLGPVVAPAPSATTAPVNVNGFRSVQAVAFRLSAATRSQRRPKLQHRCCAGSPCGLRSGP